MKGASSSRRGNRQGGLFTGGDRRLRSGWRLAIFLGFFLLFLLLLQRAAVGVLGAPPVGTLSWWTPLPPLTAALIASWFVAEKVEGMPLAALGLPWGPGALRSLGAGTAVGAAVMGLAVAGLAVAGWLRWIPEEGGGGAVALGALRLSALLAASALAEELLFRGYPLQLLAERAGGAAAIGITAVAFGLVHLPNPGVGLLGFGNIVLSGLLLGLAYWRTYSLWFVTGVHVGWNWMIGVAVDLPVSGITLEMPGFEPILRGPTIWTGGAFGPEGGLAVTLAVTAGLAWVARTRRLSRSLPVSALGPLPDRRRGDHLSG